MALDRSVFHRWIRLGVVLGGIVFCMALIAPWIQMNRERSRRTISKNNLKQLVLALHNYHETYWCFPPGGTFDAAGGGYHGWGMLLIPQLDGSPIYPSIDFRQPWNSPFNSAYTRSKLPVYLNPSISEQVGENEFGVAHYSANSFLLAANSGVKLSDIENRASTFIVAEVRGDFVPWACPYNWRPLISFAGSSYDYGRKNDGGHFVMVDGSVRWINAQVSEVVLTALRGVNLAEEASAGLKIIRPKSFPLPPDGLRFDSVQFGEDLQGLGMRNRTGELVQLSINWDFDARRGANDAVLSRLVEYRQLEALKVKGNFTDDGLRAVAQLSSLKTLELDSSKITDDGLLALASLKGLRHLTIGGTTITPAGIATLAKRMPDCKINE